MLAHRIRLSTLALLGVVVASSAAPQSGSPKAVLTPTRIDFGLMAHGDVTSRTLTLENQGDAPLLIRHIRPNCGCAKIENPGVIAPHSKVELTIDFDTETLIGKADAVVNIFTNDPASPRLDLSLSVESRPYVWAEPGHFRYIVHQHYEGDPKQSLLVMATAPSAFAIERVEAPPYMKVSFHEATREERNDDVPGSQWVVDGHLDPNAPVGPLNDWVRIYTDHDRQAKLALAISGFIRPMMHITPPRKEFGDIELSDEGFSWSHLVRNFAVELVGIEKVETNIDGLEATIADGKNDHEFIMTLKLPVDAPKGPFEGTVTVFTSSLKVPRLEIPISGTIR